VRAGRATHFYVYYRIVADTAPGRARIRALMADVEARTGVRGALLARSDDPSTWMESYGPVTGPAKFARVLAALAHDHDAAALTADGKRHVEQFATLPSALSSPGRRRTP
jgi:hypothetical protein